MHIEQRASHTSQNSKSNETADTHGSKSPHVFFTPWITTICELETKLGPLIAKNPTHFYPYPNIITLIFIPHPPQNIRKKLNPTHPIILLTPRQPIIRWKPIETPWVQLIVSHQANCIHIH
jgi:hypothetical protein